ncbi:MAG: hypothetical protein ACREP7_18940 [Lysobacter sp.]
MEDALLLLAPLLVIGLNLGLWRLSRRYTRFAGAMMFVLSAVVASPLLGLLCWNLASTDVETSYAGSYGDAFLAIGAALFNALAALIGLIAAALRKPAVVAPPARAERVRLRSD